MRLFKRQRAKDEALLITSIILLGSLSSTVAFAPVAGPPSSPIIGHHRKQLSERRRFQQPLREKSSNEEDNGERNVLGRFWNPRIDDPALPLTEAGLVQVVAPTLQLFWLVSLESPYPSWAQPLYDYTFAPQGAFLAPTLIHGAGLACCWLGGCLAARAYEKPSFRAQDGDYGRVVSATIKAGAFACGILVLATQYDVYREFGAFVQVGESPESDLRIYRALVEVINDVFFECIVLLPWRLFRSNFD